MLTETVSVLLVLVVVLDKRDANNNIYYRPLLILVIHYSKDFLGGENSGDGELSKYKCLKDRYR